MYSILNEQPPPMTGLRPDIPAELDRIVRRSLEKIPGDRYQHAGDVARELHDVLHHLGSAGAGENPAPGYDSRAGRPIRMSRRVWMGAAALVVLGIGGFILFRLIGPTGAGSFGGKKMLAVLPFENLGSPEQEYFADGITDEITSRLSGLSGLGVIARSSAMQYKKTTKSLKQIGQDLAVSYVLQGTVRWEGSGAETRVRVTPQLIAVGDETQIWSEPFESVLSGAFKLQKEIAGNVASALNITLLQPERNSLEAALTTNSEAYDNYLRAVSLTNRSFGEKDFRMAEQFLKKAVDLDSLFAAAHARLSTVHSDMYWEYYDRTDQRVQQAKEAAERALRLNPTLALAHVAMGVYYYHCRLEYENALKEFELALALQPNYPAAWLSVAAVKRRQGKFEEAAEDFEKVVAADPRSGGFFAELSITYLKLRKFPEAARSIEKAIELSPEWPEPYALKALMLLRWTGDAARARAALEEGARKSIRSQDVIMTYAGVTIDVADGHYEDALRRLTRMDRDRIDRQEFFIPADLLKARIYGYMKQTQRERLAYESSRVMLEKASREHPEDSRLHGALGVDYAGLGRKEDALREGRLAVEQLPIAREGVRGPYRAEELALTYVMVGEYDEAVTILEQLLSVPSDLTGRSLRLDPAWAPLRGNPRFERLVANAP
jgi:TolB-like protein/Flp pilus assembly protein TadD